MRAWVLFDDVAAGRAVLLEQLVRQDVLLPDALPQLDALLQSGWADGLHAVVFADYEYGLALQKLPQSREGVLKLLWFARRRELDADGVAQWLQIQGGQEPAGISTPQMNVSQAEYADAVSEIHEAIRRGDTYQINYTVRLHLQSYGSPARLYGRLRQQVPYAVLACVPDTEHGAEVWQLCFSPELFLRIDENGRLATEPMKGTAPCLGDGLDAERAEVLRNDPKNRAENTMIVDLLRNDLGKLARVGGVSVPQPFKVSAFGSVWQMTSLVQAELKDGVGMADIMRAAFPCGSITGAPKRKSMEIIKGLETEARGLYTGSIGYLEAAPKSRLGFRGCLNVVIRTLELERQRGEACYRGRYGVGSGIVIDSKADDEYAECGWKARFLNELRPEFGVFETMRAENGCIALWDAHVQRMQAAAFALNIPFARQAAEQCVHNAAQRWADGQVHRVKLLLDAQGGLTLESVAQQPLQGEQRFVFADEVLPDCDPLRRHKTTHRAVFDRAWQAAAAQGAFDGLLFNASGYLLEGGRSSVLVKIKGKWLAPAAELMILDSIARRQALAQFGAEEAWITREMLLQAEAVKLGNAFHGWLDARLSA